MTWLFGTVGAGTGGSTFTTREYLTPDRNMVLLCRMQDASDSGARNALIGLIPRVGIGSQTVVAPSVTFLGSLGWLWVVNASGNLSSI